MLDKKYHCPVEVTLDVIGGKWKCVILWCLSQRKRRFSDFKGLIPGITHKVLTEKLRELEQDGIVFRQVYAEKPPRVEYSLTDYGESIRPITDLMCAWGKIHKAGYEFSYFSQAHSSGEGKN